MIISFIGTLVSALLSAVFGKSAHRFSVALLALSSLIGAVSAITFIVRGDVSMAVLHLPFFYESTLTLDVLSATFYATVEVITFFVAIFAIRYLEMEKGYDLRSLNAFTSLFVLGMLGVLLVNTVIGFLFFWEIMSISSFFLVQAHKESASIRAALFYLIMTHLGAGAILAGFLLISGENMFASFQDVTLIAGTLPNMTLYAAFGLFLFGFGSKAGLVPFHVWLPEAHPQAPSHISALMSGVMLKIAVYGFLRVVFSLMPPLPVMCAMVVIILGLLSALYGVLYAVLERDIKRMLAFSSIENLGLIFTMIGAAMLMLSINKIELSTAFLSAAVLHMVSHAVFKSGLFLGAGVMVEAAKSRSLEAMGGLAKRMPQFSVAMLILVLGAAALPPFGAFFSEWTFLQTLVDNLTALDPVVQGIYVATLASMALVGGLAVFAMVKMFGIGFLAEPRTESSRCAREPDLLLRIPIIALAFLTVGLGILSPFIISSVELGTMQQHSPLASVTTPGGGFLYPTVLLTIFVFLIVLVYAGRRLFSNHENEREYHTWDCGQPITSGMEYTATAFSGPIRFFFRPLLAIRKQIVVERVLDTNPWITKQSMILDLRSFWYDLFYVRIADFWLFVSTQTRRIQNGVIQFYIALILIALVVTMTIAL